MRKPLALLRRTFVAVALCMTLGATGWVGTAAAEPAAVPSVGHRWAEIGPYTPEVSIGLVHTLYYPRDLGQRGEKHPIVLWGNGTGALPGAYASLLRHYASHGFVVVAANSPNVNFAITMRSGIDLMEREAADPNSVFFGNVDLDRIGAAGHSQGGSGAINAAIDKRVDTVVAIQPGPLNDVDLIDVPVLYLAGQFDLIVRPALVRALYEDADHVPAEYLELRGAIHFGTAITGGANRGPSTAWLRYWLLDDPNAATEFFGENCGYCSDTRQFSGFERNELARQIPG
ncbi:acetylxylan esterase [Rhodococcus triatomae]|uniref:Chlorophyllase enzyme n=1 Tax=Rhodococcus triatomae TaxID=300028 RepID=A0A1G8M718_9NOCA|nr:acetylxylan esterase [Rhodococcus triatomae]QNG18189.1 acetylxylan esterase [Rhodococcus triatomae]QNG22141.1 acetylxylan esterase [Rhodococcus triatomae]SDI63160.1 Chlorophyllase enzyme [Rhodococcus triatomae]